MNANKLEKVTEMLVKLVNYLDQYKAIANAQTVDFITHNHWKNLISDDIDAEMKRIPTECPGSSSFYENVTCETYPSSAKFISNCQEHTVEQMNMVTVAHKFLPKNDDTSSQIDGFMNQKKRHEVELLTKFVKKFANTNDTQLIVDIGSGKGYLGSHLSELDNFKVVGIDSCLSNSHGALVRQQKINRVLKRTGKSTSEENVLNYKAVTKRLNSRTDLVNVVPEMKTNPSVMMTGLHACGNLSSCILQIFNRTEVKSLCLVGCCYHHIEERYCCSPFDKNLDESDPGFPLSKPLLDLKFSIGRNARMLACQPIERIRSSQVKANRSLFYRALLQLILYEKIGKEQVRMSAFQVGRIARKCSTFNEYVRKALLKLNIADKLTITDEEIDAYSKNYATYEDLMYKFYYIRAILAPVIETLILLDRLHYLLEQPHIKDAYIVKLFDPVISPRCYAIVANK